jgi:adenosylcobinamide kinase/adenosylcobinamide-phosphate guanylyltransferase
LSHKIILITGGARSGKSKFALGLAAPFNKKVFLATAQPFDQEMKVRIQRHQNERGNSFETYEEPLEIAQVIKKIPPHTDLILIDCLTVWLGNLLHKFAEKDGDYRQITEFYKTVQIPPCNLIIVTNEVGLGIIPDNQLSRRFCDQAGFLNQKIASLADHVYLLVSGVPVKIK